MTMHRPLIPLPINLRTNLILVLVTLAVFSPTLFNDFQRGWDDQWQVLDNPYVTEFTWNYISYHFTQFYHGQYSPVNTLFYILTYAVSGFNPMAFHIMTLTIHIANTMLVFVLAGLILETQQLFTKEKVTLYSGLVALIFAVHPMQVNRLPGFRLPRY